MSVRCEWASAPSAYVYLIEPGDEAADGQEIESESEIGLVIGADAEFAIEGTRAEVVAFVDRLAALVAPLRDEA